MLVPFLASFYYFLIIQTRLRTLSLPPTKFVCGMADSWFAVHDTVFPQK